MPPGAAAMPPEAGAMPPGAAAKPPGAATVPPKAGAAPFAGRGKPVGDGRVPGGAPRAGSGMPAGGELAGRRCCGTPLSCTPGAASRVLAAYALAAASRVPAPVARRARGSTSPLFSLQESLQERAEALPPLPYTRAGCGTSRKRRVADAGGAVARRQAVAERLCPTDGSARLQPDARCAVASRQLPCRRQHLGRARRRAPSAVNVGR